MFNLEFTIDLVIKIYVQVFVLFGYAEVWSMQWSFRILTLQFKPDPPGQVAKYELATGKVTADTGAIGQITFSTATGVGSNTVKVRLSPFSPFM